MSNTNLINMINRAKVNNIEAINVTDNATSIEVLTMNTETTDQVTDLTDQDVEDIMGFEDQEVLDESVSTDLSNELKLADMINVNSLSSTITASLFHELGCPMQSVLAGCAIVDAIELSDNLGMPEAFFEIIGSVISTAKLESTVSGDGSITKTPHTPVMDMDKLEKAMIKIGLMNDDMTIGAKLVEMLEQRTEAYAPHKAGTDWTRRFPLYAKEKGQASPLFIEATEAQESSEFMRDERMLGYANRVQTILGMDNDDEGYVLAGTNALEAGQAYCSEFKGDSRLRSYQAACHGPNGQASDRSRALMDLAGVPQDYDVNEVKKVIKAEVMDMVNVPANMVGKLMVKALNNPVDFIIGELAKKKKDRDAAKPWSFVKAAFIWNDLNQGKRPYIGMAVGLDAKCSGPQLGALQAGDQEIAAACGFTMVEMEDAYHRAIKELVKVGFNFTMKNRNDIKKPFMGVFYGQGWAAFTNIKDMKEDELDVIVDTLYPDGVANDDVAKRFHKAITKSFGQKMVAVRSRFKEFAGKVEGRISHLMPDGAKVVMNYKVKVNILNEAVEYDTVCPDVTVTTENNTYKFIQMGLKTREVHTGDFVRNGFVNMIQATDALIARLIIVHLKRLGAQHIIAVHDCFRVNVTEMHLLENAIKLAYMDLFGSRTNIKTKDLPMGTDVLALYFAGACAQLKKGESVTPIKQFMTVGSFGEVRKMQKINGQSLPDLINALGKTYYFAK